MATVVNGVSFTSPETKSRIDVTGFTSNQPSGQQRLLLIGDAGHGKGQELLTFTSGKDITAYFRSGDLADAGRLLPIPSLDPDAPSTAQTIYVWKTNESDPASFMLSEGTGVTPAKLALSAPPYRLTPGDVLNFASDTSGGAIAITFQGTQSTLASPAAATFPISAGDIQVRVNGGITQNITLTATANIGALSAEFSSLCAGASLREDATVANKPVFYSHTFGTDSLIEIVGGTPATLTSLGNLVAATGSAGTGDAADLNAMTAAELKTKIDAQTGTDFLDTAVSPPVWTTTTTGSSAEITISASAPTNLNADVFGIATGTYSGSNASLVDCIKLETKGYGPDYNKSSFTLTEPAAGQRRFEIEYNWDGVTRKIDSGVLADSAKLAVYYNDSIGTATTATVEVSATQLILATDVAADDLTISFADYDTLEKVIDRINGFQNSGGNNVYVATALYADTESWATASRFDYISATNCFSSSNEVELYARNSDVVDWVNSESGIWKATRQSSGTGVPNTVLTKRYLSGATSGSSVTSDWTTTAINGILAAKLKFEHLVPLLSENASGLSYASVISGLYAQVLTWNGVDGKNECSLWTGMNGTAASLISTSNSYNSEHVRFSSAQVKIRRGGPNSGLVTMKEWALALLLSAMRCGMSPADSLAVKSVNIQGVSHSWDVTDANIRLLNENGVMYVLDDKARNGFYTQYGRTSYVGSNIAKKEEHVDSGLKLLSKTWRDAIEAEYIGKRSSVPTVSAMLDTSEQIFDAFGPEDKEGNGFLVPSEDEQGNRVEAYYGLTIKISPDSYDSLELSAGVNVVGVINHTLNTLVAKPARFSLTSQA